MRKERVISNYYFLTDADLAILGGKVVGALDGNANFPNLNPDLPELDTLAEDFRTKHEIASRGGSVLEVSLKNESRIALLDGLRILSHHVNAVVKGSSAQLNSTGMILAKHPTKVEVPGISDRVILRDARLKGQVRLDFTPVKNTWEYDIDVGKMGVDETILWDEQYKSTSSQGIVLAPLVSGSEVHVRVRARNGRGTGDWSNSSSIIVK